MPDAPLPAVLIPGLQADGSAWLAQAGAFDRTVVVPGGYHRAGTIDAMARAVEPDLPPRFHLVGWSMGGYVALAMAERSARRIASLALVATTARDERGAPRPGRAEAVTRARAIGMRRYQAEVLRACFADPARLRDPPARAMIDAAERLGADALAAQIAAVVARPDRRAALPGLAPPTLVLVGERDGVIPPPLSRELATAIPGARLEVVADAGHCLPAERPEVVNPLLAAWFARHDGPRHRGAQS